MLDWPYSSYFFSLHRSTSALKAFPCILSTTLSTLICTLSVWHHSFRLYLAFPHLVLPAQLWPSQGQVRKALESLATSQASFELSLHCWSDSSSSQSDLLQERSFPCIESLRLLRLLQLFLYSSTALTNHGTCLWNLSHKFAWHLEVHEASHCLPEWRTMRDH